MRNYESHVVHRDFCLHELCLRLYQLDSLGFVMILSVNVGQILRKFLNFRLKKRFTDLCVVCTYYAGASYIWRSWISKVPPKN